MWQVFLDWALHSCPLTSSACWMEIRQSLFIIKWCQRKNDSFRFRACSLWMEHFLFTFNFKIKKLFVRWCHRQFNIEHLTGLETYSHGHLVYFLMNVLNSHKWNSNDLHGDQFENGMNLKTSFCSPREFSICVFPDLSFSKVRKNSSAPLLALRYWFWCKIISEQTFHFL